MTNEHVAPTSPDASTFEDNLEHLQVALAALKIVESLCMKLGAVRTATELIALRRALMDTLRTPAATAPASAPTKVH